MNPNPIEILSAFLDGEATDPGQLAEALSTPDAREALRDFVLIRAELLSDESRPSPAFYRKMSPMLEAPARRRRWWTAAVPVPAAALAAAGALAVVLGVWTWRGNGASSSQSSDIPPEPDRVVSFQPGVDWKPDSRGEAGSSVAR